MYALYEFRKVPPVFIQEFLVKYVAKNYELAFLKDVRSFAGVEFLIRYIKLTCHTIGVRNCPEQAMYNLSQ